MTIDIPVEITNETFEKILKTALDGGIGEWCDHAEVNGEWLGNTLEEHFMLGGTIKLNSKYCLNKRMILNGIKEYVSMYYNWGIIKHGEIDADEIDNEIINTIIQLATFNEVIF